MYSSCVPRHLLFALYLDFRPLADDEPYIDTILARPECAWISKDLEQTANGYAIERVVPEHLNEVRSRKSELVERTRAAVHDRLKKEISYWDHRAAELQAKEEAGKIGRASWRE